MKKATPLQIIYLITSVILIMIFIACNSERRAARKEERSWDIYSTSPRLVQRSVPLVKALYPSAFEIVRSDTTFLPDSIPYPVIEKVPFEVLKYKDRVIDSVIGDYSVYVDSLGIQIKYLGKPQIITKRIETWHTDTREVDRLNDSLNDAHVKEAQLKGQILQIEKQLNKEMDETTKYKTYLFVVIGLIVIAVGGFLYIKFKIPLK